MWISRRSEEADQSSNISPLPLELDNVNESQSISSQPLKLVDEGPSMSSLPLELVETILSFLAESSSQLQASQVCSSWQDVVGHLWWKNLITWERKSNPKKNRSPFSTFSTSAPSAEKCALILQVSLSVQLVGVVVVLPSQWEGGGTLNVSSFASPHCGPQGPFLSEAYFQSSQHAQIGKRYKDKERSDGHQMNVLPHPLPLMPQVYYQLELCISTNSRSNVTIKEESNNDDLVKHFRRERLFGRSSPPVRSEEERELLQKPLRWFEKRREGLQPVGNQLPIIYYIP